MVAIVPRFRTRASWGKSAGPLRVRVPLFSKLSSSTRTRAVPALNVTLPPLVKNPRVPRSVMLSVGETVIVPRLDGGRMAWPLPVMSSCTPAGMLPYGVQIGVAQMNPKTLI